MTVERPVEIELKYAVADRVIGERLLNAETLAGFRATGAARPTQHEDRYMDSADGAMARAGFATRLRTAATGTIVTVKSITDDGEGSLHRREELEGPADRTTDVAGWPPSAARSLILELCGDAPLVELVTIRQLRRRRDLELPSGEAAVELSLDEVDVVARGRVVERFLELELELTRGGQADLAPLQALLDGHHGLTPAAGSKLERALVAVRRGGNRRPARRPTTDRAGLAGRWARHDTQGQRRGFAGSRSGLRSRGPSLAERGQTLQGNRRARGRAARARGRAARARGRVARARGRAARARGRAARARGRVARACAGRRRARGSAAGRRRAGDDSARGQHGRADRSGRDRAERGCGPAGGIRHGLVRGGT